MMSRMSGKHDTRMAHKLGWALLCLALLSPAAGLGQTQSTSFSDVYTTDPWYNATTTLKQLGIAHGCAYAPPGSPPGTPPLFCPDDVLLRQDMAALIVQAWSVAIWNDPEAFTYPQNGAVPSTVPYFLDVPAGSPQFVFIQKLYELGITSGYAGGYFCPNLTDNVALTGTSYCPSSQATVANYQLAVSIARARVLIDNNCIYPYNANPSSVPYTVTSNSKCAVNTFPYSSTAYFGDTAGTYYSYIQRLGDLNAYNNVYVPDPPGTCPQYGAACTFNLLGTLTRGIAAIEIVVGAGLDPQAVLGFNGAAPTTGTPITSVQPTVTMPFEYEIQPFGGEQGGSTGPATIGTTQFGLWDGTNNPYWCQGQWFPSGDTLDLLDGNTGSTSGLNQPQVDSFCTVSLVSLSSATNPTNGSDVATVTATLNFTFNASQPGTYTVMNKVTDTSGIYGPWQDVGTITVQAISPAAITLSPTTLAATIPPGNSATIPVTVSTTLVNVEAPALNVTGFPSGISFTSSGVYVYPGNPATSTVTAQVSAWVAPGVYNGTLLSKTANSLN